MIGIISLWLYKMTRLSVFLDEPVGLSVGWWQRRRLTAMAGWGKKKMSQQAEKMAKRYKLPYYFLEDGFLRSFDLGVNGEEPYSIVIDKTGIYYDATKPSDLETIICHADETELLTETKRAMRLIRQHRLSKYNIAPDIELPKTNQKRVLVVDQTRGDMSVKLGYAKRDWFLKMLEDAIAENPDAEIILKTHPDVLAGKKKGYLTDVNLPENVTVLAEDVNSVSLIEQVDKVYVVTSQMGFEALMCDKPVICYGVPWYAGWGLTIERNPAIEKVSQRRNIKRTVQTLFASAYLKYARYYDPDTDKLGDIFSVIAHLARQRQYSKLNAGNWIAPGMPSWKTAFIRSFLRSPGNQIEFQTVFAFKKAEIKQGTNILIWGSRAIGESLNRFEDGYLNVYRMEDAFIRSVGLGSNLFAPLSLVVDDRGIYYDASRPSQLEHILNTADFEPEELARARALIDRLVAAKITKYNLQSNPLSVEAGEKRVIFVPGQVEDDASIRFGSPEIKTNLALLTAVRQAHPNAFILYKPHPDVCSGNRQNFSDMDKVRAVCDLIVTDVDVIDCIMRADEVHTMTSLTGFESLIRNKKVVCYGLPFYAGWGLTTDRISTPRRTRTLTIEALAAGALLRYPRYVDPKSGDFISAERAVSLIEAQREQGMSHSVRPFLWRQVRKIMRAWRMVKRPNGN